MYEAKNNYTNEAILDISMHIHNGKEQREIMFLPAVNNGESVN
jgi:hypothetical protein